MENKLRLKKEFFLSPEDKKRILELDNLILDGDYLNGKRLPEKIKAEIDALFDKSPLKSLQQGFNSVLDIELDDLRKDPICRGNSNKRFWVKTYLLSWLVELPETLTLKKCFSLLTCREAKRIIFDKAYEQ